jgi:O-antigen/teichoic acid export membrane protein
METAPARVGLVSVIAFICALWFLLTGWIWTYLMALVLAYPVGLLSLFLYWKDSRTKPSLRLNRITLWTLRVGLAVSLGSILLFR